MCRQLALPIVLALFFSARSSIANAQDSREAVDRETSKPVVRGGIVFKAYCVLCHGERGDGAGRWARLHARLHLAVTPGSPQDYMKIIREGGKPVGRSPFMPPWQDELSSEQIGDVVAYLSVVHVSARRGEVVFKTNCMLCHGVKGNGDGRAGLLLHPHPSDLTHSIKDDRYKADIIRLGGAAMNRSSSMPPWGQLLTATEIQDVVQYLRTLLDRADDVPPGVDINKK